MYIAKYQASSYYNTNMRMIIGNTLFKYTDKNSAACMVMVMDKAPCMGISLWCGLSIIYSAEV